MRYTAIAPRLARPDQHTAKSQIMNAKNQNITHADEELDATGLLCPLPVLKTRKRMAAAPSGRIFLVRATDPASVIDFPHFCTENGHELLRQSQQEETYLFWIRKK